MRKDRGLSLLELILSTTILAVIGTFALLSFQHPRGSAQSRALAETMMEELRAARQQAVATQSCFRGVVPLSRCIHFVKT